MSSSLIHYIPIVTTILAIPFAVAIGRRYAQHPERLHLLWWAIGVGAYAAGTLTESLTALFGWQEPVFRLWYITGALLGGAPLAQGTVYLMLKKRAAHLLTAVLVLTVAVASVAVWSSPIQYELVESHRLSGRVFEWTWVRRFSPFINLYAVIFLVGGAILSAVKFSRSEATRHRMWANVWIAAGAILPGIGGAFTRFGYTEVLYVMELLGLLMMWRGYEISVRPWRTPRVSHERRERTSRARSGRPRSRVTARPAAGTRRLPTIAGGGRNGKTNCGVFGCGSGCGVRSWNGVDSPSSHGADVRNGDGTYLEADPTP